MKNLLKETIDCLINNSKQPSDVLWVGMLGYDYDKHKQFCYKTHGVIFVQKQILHIMTDLVGLKLIWD